MTHNQINYWNLQETKRSNVSREQETNRHNLISENEIERHNRATEGVDLSKLSESIRHNKVSEGIEQGKLGETIRHNQAGEGIDVSKLQETIRHNVSTEGIQGTQAAAAIQNARTNAYLASETARHNAEQEMQGRVDLNIRADQQAETVRHNKQGELATAMRTQAQNTLDYSRALLNKIDSQWKDLINQGQVMLTSSQQSKVQRELGLVETQINKLQSDITRNNFQNVESLSKSINNGLNAVTKLIPGGIK